MYSDLTRKWRQSWCFDKRKADILWRRRNELLHNDLDWSSLLAFWGNRSSRLEACKYFHTRVTWRITNSLNRWFRCFKERSRTNEVYIKTHEWNYGYSYNCVILSSRSIEKWSISSGKTWHVGSRNHILSACQF